MKFLFYSLLVLAPLPFGSARPVWQLAWAVLIGLVMVAIGLKSLVRTRTHQQDKSGTKPLVIFSLLIAVFFGWLLFAESLKDCAFYAGLAATSFQCGEVSNRGFHLFSLYAISHLIIFLLFATRAPFTSLQTLIKISAFIICCYCLYALVVYYSGTETILWFKKWSSFRSATGTFVNRNHFATYAALGLILSTTHLIISKQTTPDDLGGQVNWFANKGWLSLLMVFICFISLLLSGSRGGWLAGTVALGVLVFGAMLPKLKLQNKGVSVAWFGLAVLLFLALSLFSETLFNRFALESVDQSRLSIYAATIDVIQNNWLHGTGIARFREVFDLVRPEKIQNPAQRAHNEYLELLLAGGIIALALCLAAFAYINYAIWKRLRHKQQAGVYCVFLLSINSLFLLHSVVDFPLHIPALSMLYALLLGSLYEFSTNPRKVS